MKKTGLLLLLVVLLGAQGCGKDNNSQNNGGGSSTTSTPTATPQTGGSGSTEQAQHLADTVLFYFNLQYTDRASYRAFVGTQGSCQLATRMQTEVERGDLLKSVDLYCHELSQTRQGQGGSRNSRGISCDQVLTDVRQLIQNTRGLTHYCVQRHRGNASRARTLMASMFAYRRHLGLPMEPPATGDVAGDHH